MAIFRHFREKDPGSYRGEKGSKPHFWGKSPKGVQNSRSREVPGEGFTSTPRAAGRGPGPGPRGPPEGVPPPGRRGPGTPGSRIPDPGISGSPGSEPWAPGPWPGGPLRPPPGAYPRPGNRGAPARGVDVKPSAGEASPGSKRAQKGPKRRKTPKKGGLPVFSLFLAEMAKNGCFSAFLGKRPR